MFVPSWCQRMRWDGKKATHLVSGVIWKQIRTEPGLELRYGPFKHWTSPACEAAGLDVASQLWKNVWLPARLWAWPRCASRHPTAAAGVWRLASWLPGSQQAGEVSPFSQDTCVPPFTLVDPHYSACSLKKKWTKIRDFSSAQSSLEIPAVAMTLVFPREAVKILNMFSLGTWDQVPDGGSSWILITCSQGHVKTIFPFFSLFKPSVPSASCSAQLCRKQVDKLAKISS